MNLASVLASSLARSPWMDDAVLESRVHGTVRLRAQFVRRELLQERNEDAPMLDADTRATIREADAPEVEAGDLLLLRGSLWHVRVPLVVPSAQVKLQLQVAAPADAVSDPDGARRPMPSHWLQEAFLGRGRTGSQARCIVASADLPTAPVVALDGIRYGVVAVSPFDASRSVLRLVQA